MMPRLLLAAALAWWGWRSGHWLAAGALAVLAEMPAFVRARFELGQPEFTRVATLSTIGFVGLLVWLFASAEGGRTAYAVLTTLLWLPAVFMPLLLAQQLSAAGRVPLSALFRYVRRLKARNPATPDPAVDVAPIYFAVCLIAAAIPNQRDAVFYAGTTALVGWALLAQRPPHARLPAALSVLALAAGLGFGAHLGLSSAQLAFEEWLGERFLRGMAGDAYRSTTDLGSVGRLKQLDVIVLRVYAAESEAAQLRLLHRASYSSLVGTTWLARDAALQPLQPQADGTTWRIAEGTPGSSVRIVTRLERGKALLALPPGTLRLVDTPATTVRRNALGATEAEFGGDWAPYVAQTGAADDYPAPQAIDLAIPERERAHFERLATQLGLRGLPADEAVQRVERHFAAFSYDTYRASAVPEGSTALGDFLERSRRGHCEYFAAATALLLRAAGVPARYATGFAVNEFSRLESAYLVRARHAHAWTRAFVGGRWVDVDTTPPSWFGVEDARAPLWERFLDLARWAGFRWSQRGPLELGTTAVAVLCALLAFFAWRVTRVRRAAVPAGARGRTFALASDSEMYEVERALGARFGARTSGEPLGRWTARIAAALPGVTRDALAQALAIHYRYRFDPAGVSREARLALRERCRTVLASLH